jgi:rare lipoprotein A
MTKYKRAALWKMLLLALLCVSITLSGCSTRVKKKKDGPPKHIPANLLRTPDAVPKIEPLSRLGNRFKNGKTNTYVALRKRYHVMPTSRGYRARGHASWYGTQFHGRKTSNGEKYNMFAMTAAHPTLPLPTYAKVTNLENGKTVIVKINDRGPFHSNRLIDLSYVAAAKLGVLGKGTAHVEVESIDPRDHAGQIAKKHQTFSANRITGKPRAKIRKRY